MTRKSIRKLPGADPRVETGAVRFGSDWPGVFIRGDNAAYYTEALRALLSEKDSDSLNRKVLDSLLEEIEVAVPCRQGLPSPGV